MVISSVSEVPVLVEVLVPSECPTVLPVYLASFRVVTQDMNGDSEL